VSTVKKEYGNAAALRAAIEARLSQQAAETGKELQWLRRRLVFVRIIARLVAYDTGAWVLKGGMAVELRRPGLARATRDIDLVLTTTEIDVDDQEAVREVLLEALLDDADGDRFQFEVRHGTRLKDDAYGRPAWRFTVAAYLASKRFAELKLDIVARPEELTGVEVRELPDVLGFAGIAPRQVSVTDLRQQFAEKLHALTRSYSGGESTRVKDLVDLTLLVRDGVPADAELCRAVRHVFRVRGTHHVPTELGTLPTAWPVPFANMVQEIGLAQLSALAAHETVDAHWRAALVHESEEIRSGHP
jgi:hypothetical protein